MFESLKQWLAVRRDRPLDELLVVEFDAETIRVRVAESIDPSWNQECRWAEITRVCFRDGTLWGSDVIYLVVRDRAEAVEVPTEARGGGALFKELGGRGVFPQPAFGEAVRSTDGGLLCWPPDGAEER